MARGLILVCVCVWVCRATLKNKKEVCLDPETPVMKKAIQKILDRYTVPLIFVLCNLF